MYNSREHLDACHLGKGLYFYSSPFRQGNAVDKLRRNG